MTRRLVLASASPARLGLLRAAGLSPEVVVSGVDESTVSATEPAGVVQELALAKADAVGRQLTGDALVLGCDSMLLLDGELLGKPADAATAVQRWRAMRGRTGELLTGHALFELSSGRRECAVDVTSVHFAEVSDSEIAAYVGTGEPLRVAGAFTLDGYGAPFVERIEGSSSTVIGLSMPLLRVLLRRLDVELVELWSERAPTWTTS